MPANIIRTTHYCQNIIKFEVKINVDHSIAYRKLV